MVVFDMVMSRYSKIVRRLNIALLIVAWLFWGLLIRLFVSGETGLIANRQLEERVYEMEETIIQLQFENEQLRNEIRRRQSDFYLEELARTELRRIFPGEVIIPIPTPTPLSKSSEPFTQ
jgi:cell division protein FtsB